jgi:hypothetical protein
MTVSLLTNLRTSSRVVVLTAGPTAWIQYSTFKDSAFLPLYPDLGDDPGQALYLPGYPCYPSRGTASQHGHYNNTKLSSEMYQTS